MSLETPIEVMYRAGKVEMPDAAEKVSWIAQSLHTAIPQLDVQTALAGDPRGMRETLALCGDLHEALRRLTVSLNNCGSALVASADDFRRTDEDAAHDFKRMDPELRSSRPTEALEFPEIDDPTAAGASRVEYDDEHGSGKDRVEHIDPTPEPELPNADQEERERDSQVDPVELPEAPSR